MFVIWFVDNVQSKLLRQINGQENSDGNEKEDNVGKSKGENWGSLVNYDF